MLRPMFKQEMEILAQVLNKGLSLFLVLLGLISIGLTSAHAAPGDLDLTFDPGTGFNGEVNVVTYQPSYDHYLVGGDFTNYNGTAKNRIITLQNDGLYYFTARTGADGMVKTIKVSSGNYIFSGGAFQFWDPQVRNRLSRCSSYISALNSSYDPNANGDVNDIALQSDGKILVGGAFTMIGGVSRNHLARLNDDGSVDATFNPNANNVINELIIQPDGKILVAGEFTTIGGQTRNRIARLNSDGSIEMSFDPNVNSRVVEVHHQVDGKILIGGNFSMVGGLARNYLARLNTDGSVDSGFNPSPDNVVNAIRTQIDGKVLVGGNFTSIAATSRNRVARLNADGSIDSGFNPGSGANGVINSIMIPYDGKLVIGGNFTSYNGTARNRIARIDIGTGTVATPTVSVTSTQTVSPSPTITATSSPTVTFTSTPTATPEVATFTSTPTSTATSTATAISTATYTSSPTVTYTSTPTSTVAVGTNTFTPTSTTTPTQAIGTNTFTPTSTASPTQVISNNTFTPTSTPISFSGTATATTTIIIKELPLNTVQVIRNVIRVSKNQPVAAAQIRMKLEKKEKVIITIYSQRGRLVKKLINRMVDPGNFETVWDGINSRGKVVSAGIYIVHIQAESFQQRKRIIVVR